MKAQGALAVCAGALYPYLPIMRFAVVLAPSDPRAGDAVARREGLAWLRGQLARHGFDVAIVGGAQDPETALARAAQRIAPGDCVLVHVSGRLAPRPSDPVDAAVLAFAAGHAVPLSLVTELFAARQPAEMAFVAELMHSGDPADVELAAAAADGAVAALRGAGKTHPVVASVRPLSWPVSRLALTEYALPEPSGGGALPVTALVTKFFERAESHPGEMAQCVASAHPNAEPPRVDSAPLGPLETDDPIDGASASGNWARVVELRLERLPFLGVDEQVRELVGIARVRQSELGDPEGALETLERARTLDPERAGVLRALRRGYETQGRWASAMEVLGALEKIASPPTERAELRAAQARLALDHLGDDVRALAWLQAALEDDPNCPQALELAGRIAGHLAPGADGSVETSRVELEALAERSPFDAAPFLKLYTLALDAGDTDAALLAALSLEELGAADLNQRALIDQFRSVGPVRARAPLDAAAWDLLRAPGHDEVLADLFAAVARAAIAVRVEAEPRLRAGREQLLSENSTASVVRSFHWAARFLGLRCPDLYIVDDQKGISSRKSIEPSAALGPAVVSGPSAKDLAFLAGRHLTHLLPEYRVLSHYLTREDVTTLLFAATNLGLTAGASADASDEVRSLRAQLGRHIRPEEQRALALAVAALDARGGRATLGAFLRSVELTASRVGLFLAGDLGTATALVQSDFCAGPELPLKTRHGDLVSFCASRAHGELRARFVVRTAESVPPGAPTRGSDAPPIQIRARA